MKYIHFFTNLLELKEEEGNFCLNSADIIYVLFIFCFRKVGMTLDAAMNLCKKRRPMVDPIAPFISQLQQYEQKCHSMGLIHTVEGEEKSKAGASEREGESFPSKNLKRKAIGPAMPPLQIQSSQKSEVMDPSKNVISNGLIDDDDKQGHHQTNVADNNTSKSPADEFYNIATKRFK